MARRIRLDYKTGNLWDRAIIVILLLSVPIVGLAETSPCDEVALRLVPWLPDGLKVERAARVEVRRCGAGRLPIAFLQLCGLALNKEKPEFVLDTGHIGISQLAMTTAAVGVVTFGGTVDQIFVIVFEKGVPRLVLRRTTKGTAELRTAEDALTVVIREGNAAPKTFRFSGTAYEE